MILKDWMIRRLNERFSPSLLIVVDESHLHIGHVGWRESGETHFRVDIVSQAFNGKSRVETHRLVNEALSEAFGQGLHALAIKARGE